MNRDMDLVRKLLIWFDAKKDTRGVRSDAICIEGHDQLTVRFHILLLAQRGLVDHEPMKSSTSDRIIDALVFNLTWEGFELLDAIRDDAVWAKVKKQASKVGVWSVELLKDIAIAYAKQKLQSKFGIAA